MTRQDGIAFEKGILKILAATTGSGNFEQVVNSEPGPEIRHGFGWCTGMASSFWAWKYRKKFKKPVAQWVGSEHPYRRSQLFQIAISHSTDLPDKKPVEGSKA